MGTFGHHASSMTLSPTSGKANWTRGAPPSQRLAQSDCLSQEFVLEAQKPKSVSSGESGSIVVLSGDKTTILTAHDGSCTSRGLPREASWTERNEGEMFRENRTARKRTNLKNLGGFQWTPVLVHHRFLIYRSWITTSKLLTSLLRKNLPSNSRWNN